MSKFVFRIFLAIVAISIPIITKGNAFEVGNGTFLMDSQPYVIKAAELHYPRIPRPYWDHRIKMAKALGMNTVCLYVFWNAHEPEKGLFDFSGQNDLREFVKLCQANGMYVILRPGPYVCAEWEMGGLPWWLLEEDVPLRTDDERFLAYVKRFEHEVARQLKGLTVAEGGPLIMVQVENEYGSYGENPEYIKKIRDILRSEYCNNVVMFQCDWSSNFTLNGLDDLLWTMNFGTGADVKREFEPLKKLRPDSPLMCSEYWSGWFDKWGANHETRQADDMVAGIDTMLANNISFSLYMTHGGTNFGHWAGANSPGYAPNVTSYDYDAPVDEQGSATPKFMLLRNLIQKYSPDSLPSLPAPIPTGEIRKFKPTQFAPLIDNFQEFNPSPLRSMEKYGQGFGSIVYRNILDTNRPQSELDINGVHDYARIYLNGNAIGEIDRRLNQKCILLPPTNKSDTLDIFVEAMGRINFGKGINDYKGITGSVILANDTLNDWSTSLWPDNIDFYESMSYQPVDQSSGPGIYKGSFILPTDVPPADTFLDMSTWGKGMVYVNRYPLGRFWNIGPQQTLYLPGCWLNKGENEIMVVDILGPDSICLQGLSSPINDKVKLSDSVNTSSKPDLSNLIPLEFTLQNKPGWQHIEWPEIYKGKKLAIEFAPLLDENKIKIAEFYLTGNGRRLPRIKWQPAYSSSSNKEANRTLSKVIDLQESTYWEATSSYKQLIVFDLGESISCNGMDILPVINENDTNSSLQLNIYLYGD